MYLTTHDDLHWDGGYNLHRCNLYILTVLVASSYPSDSVLGVSTLGVSSALLGRPTCVVSVRWHASLKIPVAPWNLKWARMKLRRGPVASANVGNRESRLWNSSVSITCRRARKQREI